MKKNKNAKASPAPAKKQVKNVTTKKRKRYTMTPAALAQRAAAHRKPNSCHDWTTAKVSAALSDWAKENFGSVNAALDHLRKIS